MCVLEGVATAGPHNSFCAKRGRSATAYLLIEILLSLGRYNGNFLSTQRKGNIFRNEIKKATNKQQIADEIYVGTGNYFSVNNPRG